MMSSPLLLSMTLGAVLLGAVHGQSTSDEDLVLGTWVLNVEKSSYSPGPAPKSQERVYEKHPEGVKVTITTTRSNGETVTAGYVADYDSIEYPLTGSPAVDAIALTRINAHAAEATLKHASKTIGYAKRTISEDGRTMTISYEGAGADGDPVKNTAVYEKRE